MPTRLRIPPTLRALLDILQQPDIPEELEQSTTGELEPAPARSQETLIKTRDAVQQVTALFVATYFALDKDQEFLEAVKKLAQLILVRLGVPDNLPMLAHPTNSQEMLVPAVDAIVAVEPDLRNEARAIFKGIDMEGVVKQRDRLVFVRELIDALFELNHGLEVASTHLEQGLDATARLVDKRSASITADNAGLEKALKKLDLLIRGDAQTGVQTRRDNEKLVAKTEAKAKAPGGHGEPPPAGGTPGGHGGTPPATGGPPSDVPGVPAPHKTHTKSKTKG